MSTTPSGGSPTVRYLASDHLGGTAIVMDDAGNQVSRTRYLPYGQQWTREGSTSPTDKMFTGHQREGQTSGLYFMQARFYSADLGWFLSPDPIRSGGANPYEYVGSNPLSYTDPTGMYMEGIDCSVGCPLHQQHPRYVDLREYYPPRGEVPGWVDVPIDILQGCDSSPALCGSPTDAGPNVCRSSPGLCAMEDTSGAGSIGVEASTGAGAWVACGGGGVISDSGGVQGYVEGCGGGGVNVPASASVDIVVSQVFGTNAKGTEHASFQSSICLHAGAGGCIGLTIGDGYFMPSVGVGIGVGGSIGFTGGVISYRVVRDITPW